ncbi:MAG: hypothetical protein KAJ81_09270, partial [Candidatus Latescibacteria bacterium]|nr:hypothetical protein [Candidatus Latescibacterota bacterium]
MTATCKSPKNEGTQLRSQRQNDYIIVIAEAILLEVFLVDTPFIELCRPIGLPRLRKKTILAAKSAKGTKTKINYEIVFF